MTTTIATTTFSTYTTTVVALTTPWPYTSGCETQFVVVDLDSTREVTAFDPSLWGVWNTDALPRWYSETECLPRILTSTYANHIQVGSLVCPESWSQAPYSSPYTGVGQYITCCPPKYTLAPTSTIGQIVESACTSAVSAGQVIVGVDAGNELLVYENVTTTQGYPMSTITYQSADHVIGFMLTASWYDTLSHTAPAYTNYGGGSSSGSDYNEDPYDAYNRYLAVRLGAGITIPVVFLIISITVSICLYRRRKRRLQNHNPGPQMGQQTSYNQNQYGQPPNNGMQNQYFPGGPSQYTQQGYMNQSQPPNNNMQNQYESPNQYPQQGYSDPPPPSYQPPRPN